ncbi:MAG: TRAP transporter permease [Eubacteriales bacterium]|nr:TRAP transporter permease [Eubacteriales bacterium]
MSIDNNNDKKIDNDISVEQKVQEVMEKYDRESNVRKWEGIPREIVKFLLVFFALYSIAINFFFHFETRINRASFVGALVFFVFLLFPAKKGGGKKRNYIPWYDIILGLSGSVAYFYFVFNLETIFKQGIVISPLLMILGGIGIITTLEACRRAVGLPIVIVASFFLCYGLYAKITGSTSTNPLYGGVRNIIYNIFYTTEGVIGTPIRACSTFIVLFVIFGAFLDKTGIAEFFIELANSIAGASSGGPAKVAVISSALCGMVSGSSVGNTVTTGAVTIPLMKKSGYKGEFAGAVEAAASTGGQIMPPIMGAAAFLMVEYTGQAYGYIAIRACLPALLYFAGIFISVHLEAKRLGLKGISKEELPILKQVLIKSWFLLLPLIVLTVMIIKTTMGYAAIVATLLAIVVAIISDFTQHRIGSFSEYIKHFFFGCFKDYNKDVMSLNKIIYGLEAGAKSTVTVGIACAVAGIIACIITITGIGNILISAIVSLAQGKMIIAMFLTMITCIILGMGVPTTANYVIMATTCAPILVRMGMNQFAAHMFVFYFGIVADITPPVALAAYAGSAIAGSKPMKTAFNATLLAIAAFIVPYVFGLDPKLLFIFPEQTGNIEVILTVIRIVATSLLGIFGIAAGIRGYALKKINVIGRIIIACGGLLLIDPGSITDIVGIVLIFSVLGFELIEKKFMKKNI